MIELRPFDSLGRFRTDWLNARHHFSFGHYVDANRPGWGALRVWNDDEIAPGTGFDPHPHRDMEIITYVRDGAVTHEDHMGNAGRTVAGDVQVMSAGEGVVHAEYNKEKETTRIFQIWIEPDRTGGPAAWRTAAFPKADRAGALTPLASGDHGDQDRGALPIRADAKVLGATIGAGESVDYAPGAERHVYLTVARGRVKVGDVEAGARDGVAIHGEDALRVTALEDAEILLTDTR